jgi:beta-lactam-binding protein with PASTA domain
MTLKKLLIILILIVGLLGLLSFGFFYKLLPALTNKDQVVTVPDIRGMTLNEAADFLKSKDLDFSISDTAFNLDKPPLTILEHYPRPNSKVKVNRKINLVLNAQNPPTVLFPDLNGFSFEFAQRQLKTFDLRLGTIQYKPDIAHNAVLESRVKGQTIVSGQRISKGTTIDLIIGSPNDKFPMPDFQEMELDDVETVTAGLNLKIIELHNVSDNYKKENLILKQLPPAGDTVRHGDKIELWIYNLKRQ